MSEDGDRAPSLILYYKNSNAADILTQDVYVPCHGVANFTYYCCLCWNSGANGGGYCGIQEHPDGRCYIYSIWDPQNVSEPIKALVKGPGTETSKFGGEGTGLKSMNFALGWEPDNWYTLVTRRWEDRGHTIFGFWVNDQTNRKWSHIVSMDFPEPGIFFNQTSSFLEDWHGNGKTTRCVKYKNGQKRLCDGSWSSLTSADFLVNQEDACRKYNDNFDACVDSGCYFMQSGHGTCPTDGVGTQKELTCDCEDGSSHPTPKVVLPPPIQFQIKDGPLSKLEWTIDESETPQFKYSIKADGVTLLSEVNPRMRSCEIDLSQFSKVVLELEDILGQKTSQTIR